MAAAREESNYLQVRFICKIEKYAVPKTPFSLPSTAGCEELNSLINGLLHEGEEDGIEFDFLINHEILSSSLNEFVKKRELSTESVIEIEYLLKSEKPNLELSLLHDDWVSCVDMLKQRILSGSYDHIARVWNLKGELCAEIKGHTAAVKSIASAVNEDGKSVIFTGSQDQTIMLWEWSDETNECSCMHVCKGHAGSVDSVACGPSTGKFCSASWDKMIKIWSAALDSEAVDEIDPDRDMDRKRHKGDQGKRKATTRTPLLTMSGHTEAVSSVLWMTSSEIASGSWDHSIRLWDLTTGLNKQTMQGRKVITSISYSELSGLIASGNTDKYVRLWDPRSSDGLVVKSTLESHEGWISSVYWSPINQYELVSGAYDMKTKVWDIRNSSTCLYDLDCYQDKVLCVNWKDPGIILSGGADNQLAINRYNTFRDTKE